MAKQKSIVKLEGKIGDIVFSKTADGYIAREASPLSGKRIATDPSFQRTRENMSEFGRAGKAAKLVRNSISSWVDNAKDAKLSSRLTRLMVAVLKADKTSKRGQRNVIDGETALLEGFEFNVNAPLDATLIAPFAVAVDRVAGTAGITLQAFKPEEKVKAPDGATHYKISVIAAEFDFEAQKAMVASQETEFLPWDNTLTAPLTFIVNLTANSTKPIFLFVGIQFTQEVNGEFYSLKNGSFNALKVVAADSGS